MSHPHQNSKKWPSLRERILSIAQSKIIAFDVETRYDYKKYGDFNPMGNNELIGLGVQSKEDHWYFNLNNYPSHLEEEREPVVNDESFIFFLQEAFCKEGGLAIAHNAIYDYTCISRAIAKYNAKYNLSLKFKRSLFCTMEAEFLMYNKPFQSLNLLAKKYGFGPKDDKPLEYILEHKLYDRIHRKKPFNPRYENVPDDILRLYCTKDTKLCYLIGLKQLKALKEME